MNYFLIGMPASGKTTVGKSLAKMLGLKQFDTDEEIVERYGSIAGIFKNHDEEYFRALETETLKKAASFNNIVVSTGGGTPLKEQNAAIMRSSGKIIYLTAEKQTLLSRLNGDGGRPLLAGETQNLVENMLKTRAPVYERTSDIRVSTDGLAPDEIAAEIIKILGNIL